MADYFEITDLGNFIFTPGVTTSGVATPFLYVAPANTGLTASTESIGVNWNTTATKTWAAGALSTQREHLFQAPTYSISGGASTIDTAATVAITGAPIAQAGTAITNSLSLWVQNGNTRFDGNFIMGGAGVTAIYNKDNNVTKGYIQFTADTIRLGNGISTNPIYIDNPINLRGNINFNNGFGLRNEIGETSFYFPIATLDGYVNPTRVAKALRFDGNGVDTILSTDNLNFKIDSRAALTTAIFTWSKGAGTELMRLNEAGQLGIGISPNVNLDVLGDMATRATSPGQITSNQNDFSTSSSSFLRLNSDASRNITGFANGYDGKQLIISNVGANPIVLTNQDVLSALANRIITGNSGVNLTLLSNDSVRLIYDLASARWRILNR